MQKPTRNIWLGTLLCIASTRVASAQQPIPEPLPEVVPIPEPQPLPEPPPQPHPFIWSPLAVPPGWPQSIQTFQGVAIMPTGAPARAWYVSIDYKDRSLRARPFISETPEGKEPTSTLAAKVGALVAINGGYFDMTGKPAQTYSLVFQNGKVLKPGVARVMRDKVYIPVVRSAFGVRADRKFEIAWTAHRDGRLLNVPQPIPNAPGKVPPPLEQFLTDAKPWLGITDAIGAGPVLLRRGEVAISYNEEAFFGAGFTDLTPYPRAAVGSTADNRLIFFVVDGKHPEYSAGLTLPELADEMRKLGCVEALNLDGGGSVTLVVNGLTVNQPSGGKERPVTSIFAIVPAVVP